MPELPEVETIRLGLEKKILGLEIKKVEVLNPKSFIGNPKFILNKKIIGVWRRGKMLGLNLAGPAHSSLSEDAHPSESKTAPLESRSDSLPRRASSLTLFAAATRQDLSSLSPAEIFLVFHLKMSGQIIWDKGKVLSIKGGHPNNDIQSQMPVRSTRVIFTLSDKSKLFFNDQRKFGWVKVTSDNELKDFKFLQSLGPEPLTSDFNWKILKINLLKHKKSPIKVVLLDQSVVAGIGNIYACEACFLAKIDPRRKVDSLNDNEIKRLVLSVERVLSKGIEYGGSSRTHYVNIEGRRGNFLGQAYVYNRDKKPCKVCGTLIEKIRLGGRGTFFCPNCQK